MTALVAVETINRFKILTVTQSAFNTEGTLGNLSVGESFKSEEFLYPLLLTSSNDVAELYRNEVWKFVDIMNQKARAVGMTHTKYKDASGLNPDNVSTAADTFRLLQFIRSNKEPIFTLSGLKEYKATSRDPKRIAHVWKNINWPGDDDRFIGGKSGTTPEAGQAMAGVYKIKFSEYGERHIAIIVLRSPDRIKDIHALISYLERQYIYGTTLTKREVRTATTTTIQVRQGANLYEAIDGFLH